MLGITNFVDLIVDFIHGGPQEGLAVLHPVGHVWVSLAQVHTHDPVLAHLSQEGKVCNADLVPSHKFAILHKVSFDYVHALPQRGLCLFEDGFRSGLAGTTRKYRLQRGKSNHYIHINVLSHLLLHRHFHNTLSINLLSRYKSHTCQDDYLPCPTVGWLLYYCQCKSMIFLAYFV